ncbi:MAG: flagellar assembly protein FliW [Phycisphaerae bacterium]|nr:flagellar assembly protein FliW [Phycisphaerae bacterium]
MLIETTRFGTLEVDGTKIIHFKDGILGFPEHRRYALIQTSPDPVFFWLQSVDDPSLAFIVCDPQAFVPDYQIPIRQDDLQTLEMDDVSDSQVLVIVNRVDGYLVANLLGPLVVGAQSLQARQMVLSDRKHSTRHRLMPIESPAAVSKTA